MSIKPVRLKPLFNIIEKINMPIVLISIAGLILEYTPLKYSQAGPIIIIISKVIDVYFVFDFLVRLLCLPSGQYFFRGYGWVDLLASLPGLSIIFQANVGFLALFKVTRIGRFFKIIRVLRFLRIFSFLKKMKSDSTYIQERIMKIGVAIVLIFVAGISMTDYFSRTFLIDSYMSGLKSSYKESGLDTAAFASKLDEAVYYMDSGRLYSKDGERVDSEEEFQKYKETVGSETMWYETLSLNTQQVSLSQKFDITLPAQGLVLRAESLISKYNIIMLISVLTLIILLVVIIFYIGFIFARDMRTVQLIIDSIDADDFMLLKEEAKRYKNDDEDEYELVEGEDEIDSLIKMVAKLVQSKEESEGVPTDGYGLEMSFSSQDYNAVNQGMEMMNGGGSDDYATDGDDNPDTDHVDLEVPDIDDSPSMSDEEISGSSSADPEDIKEALREVLSEQSAQGASIDEDTIINALEEALQRNGLDGSRLKQMADDSAVAAVKVATKSIVEYIKKNIK